MKEQRLNSIRAIYDVAEDRLEKNEEAYELIAKLAMNFSREIDDIRKLLAAGRASNLRALNGLGLNNTSNEHGDAGNVVLSESIDEIYKLGF
jgi:hypothetical protein